MKRALIPMCILLLVFASGVSAKDLRLKGGWVSGEQTAAAVDQAKRVNMPIVFLYAFSKSRCPKHNSRLRLYLRDKSLRGMVKVVVWCEEPLPRPFSKVAGQVGQDHPIVPRMYVADPQLRILGFIRNNVTGTQLGRIASIARENVAWQARATKAFKKARKRMAAGKFRAASKIYKKAKREDKTFSVLIAQTWGERLPREQAELVFFPELKNAMEEVTRRAQARLDKATELYENRQYAEARKLLEPMVKDKADLEPVREAAELLEKVKEAMKKRP